MGFNFPGQGWLARSSLAKGGPGKRCREVLDVALTARFGGFFMTAPVILKLGEFGAKDTEQSIGAESG
jgi:hypothetical protein